eukprot:TRINITY_DN106917_c0_g1_i1.p1 TRINITY_DN106917_c0_g1~~TRINITY_DN106917_c0_g1_i1.p1  ORF type:complete len:325 (-),score=-15.92 TRINITY_DN106917_c0_g1_i1:86-1060(-)
MFPCIYCLCEQQISYNLFPQRWVQLLVHAEQPSSYQSQIAQACQGQKAVCISNSTKTQGSLCIFRVFGTLHTRKSCVKQCEYISCRRTLQNAARNCSRLFLCIYQAYLYQKREDLLKFINDLKNDTADYTEVINTKGLQCWTKYDSIFDKTKPVTKTRHVLGPNIDPLVVAEMLNNKRMNWDKNLERHEELMKISPSVSIIYTAMKSPSIFFQARDLVEKRIQLIEQDTYYAYFSSVPDSVYPVDKAYCRCDTIFAATVIRLEDGECVYYSISQTDLKAPSLPQALVMPFFKSGVKSFYEALLTAVPQGCEKAVVQSQLSLILL